MDQSPGFLVQGESCNQVCCLHKSLYIKESLKTWIGRFNVAVQQFGMTHREVDHFVFCCNSIVGCIYLVVYIDNIVLIGSDLHGILQIKKNTFIVKRPWQTQILLGN